MSKYGREYIVAYIMPTVGQAMKIINFSLTSPISSMPRLNSNNPAMYTGRALCC